MLALEVEDLGTIDLKFLYCFDNIPKKFIQYFKNLWWFDSIYISVVQVTIIVRLTDETLIVETASNSGLNQ